MLFGSTDAFSAEAKNYIQFAYGVLGAVLFGWAVMILFLLMGSFRQGSRESWQALTLALVCWYVVDTGFSVYSGFWQNGVLNTVFFVLFIIPILATRPKK